MRSWRNWQTHQLEGLAVAIPWWFESTRPQTYSKTPCFIGVLSVFNKIRTRRIGPKWTERDRRVRLAGGIGNRPSTDYSVLGFPSSSRNLQNSPIVPLPLVRAYWPVVRSLDALSHENSAARTLVLLYFCLRAIKGFSLSPSEYRIFHPFDALSLIGRQASSRTVRYWFTHNRCNNRLPMRQIKHLPGFPLECYSHFGSSEAGG
jgi:hypothetical protein